MVTHVILIRHGRSNYNQMGRFQGSCDDSYLIAEGIETSERTGQYLQRFKIDRVFVSPLQRAQQTLAVMHTVNPQIPDAIVLEDLREIDLPQWQGLPYQQVRTDQASAYSHWKHDPHTFMMQRGDGAEAETFLPVMELFDRAQSVWKTVISQPNEAPQQRTILIVSHGGTIQALIATALGLPSHIFHRLQQCNCGVSTLQFSNKCVGHAQLTTLNFTQHLQPMPKLKEGKQGLRQLFLVEPSYNDMAFYYRTQYRSIRDQALAHTSKGVTTQLRAIPVPLMRQHLQDVLAITFKEESLPLAGSICVLHKPNLLRYTIIQSIWPLCSTLLGKNSLY